MPHAAKYTWAFILLAIAFGFLLPTQGTFLRPGISLMLITLMTIACLKINLRDIKRALVHKEAYLIVLATLILSPLIAFSAKSLLDPLSFAGLILAAAVPAGVSIVFISSICKGKPSDALSITTLAHILSIITIPLILKLMVDKTVGVGTASLLLTLLKFIVLPLILAQILRNTLMRVKGQLTTISTALLFLIIWGIIAPTRELILQNPGVVLTLLPVCAAVILIVFGIGWLIGKTKEEKITYAIGASYKNYTLSTVIALNMFGELAVLASIAYTLLNNLLFAALDYLVANRK